LEFEPPTYLDQPFGQTNNVHEELIRAYIEPISNGLSIEFNSEKIDNIFFGYKGLGTKTIEG
jgi:hypothetical protein